MVASLSMQELTCMFFDYGVLSTLADWPTIRLSLCPVHDGGHTLMTKIRKRDIALPLMIKMFESV